MSGLSEAQGLTASSDINNGNITNSSITNSPISGSTGSFTTVSADNAAGFNSDVTVSGKLTVGQAVSAASFHSNAIISAGTDVNAGANLIAGARTIICSGDTGQITTTGTIIPSFAIISAAGVAQGTASLVSAQNCSLMGVADGATTGFRLLANKTGMTQCLFMNTAASGNLWPPTGGHINALANDAAFPLAANTMYTVFHYAASAYGVK